ncbi:hypothetical protein HPB50_014032 [Hyalomma asiaticum]|uniref:Uncharacterized protein n=1 Tax=Hyalomma asiaticum TaxID=266040 RepID=A0ACB7T7Q0_HYAAI|nr:hypothetical protein HPB50_014032 [Hyalomma asiaticum]
MGRYPDVQEKMRQEALEAFAKEGDHLSLQTLTTLPYSNQVIFETMRLYPAAVIATTRSSDDDYRYGKYVIKKGTSVMVPTYQLHHDPMYWNEPEKFDPERFSPENKQSINPTAYQPFGLGPRMCPGHRLALAELVSAAAEILRHYSITLGRSQKSTLAPFHSHLTQSPCRQLRAVECQTVPKPTQPVVPTAMSFNWCVATGEDLATLSVHMIKTELQRRSLSTTGSKEEIINRLIRYRSRTPATP